MSESIPSASQHIESLWALGGLSWRELIRRVWGGIGRNDLINRAYELAYNFLLAVFPLLLFLVGLLGIFASEGSKLRTNLFYYLQLALPPSAYDLLVHTVREVISTSNGSKLTFGLLFALFSGSSGMSQLMSTLNAAFEVREKRPWIKVYLVSLGLTLAMSLLLIAALFLILAGGQVVASLGPRRGSNHGCVCGHQDSAVGRCTDVRALYLRNHLLFRAQRARAALVLAYTRIGCRRGLVGDGLRRVAHLLAFLQ